MERRGLAFVLVALAACGDNLKVPADAPSGDAVLAIDMAMLPFGTVTVGTTSPPMTLTITNTGSAPTGTLAVTLFGGDAASFATDGATCSDVLAAGASCTVPVTFTPASTGAKSAKLRIAGVPGGSVGASLDGTGLGVGQGLLSISADTNTVGSALVGDFGTTVATFTVTNIGGTDTGVLAIQPTGANPADFVVDDHCSQLVLAPNDTCTLAARVAPKARGQRTAAIEVSANPGGLVSGSLVGIGIAPARLVTAFDHRDLGTAASGDTASATITVTNIGEVASSAITASYAGGSGFTAGGGTCINASVPPGGSCTVIANLSAPTPGLYSSNVAIAAAPQGGSKIVVTLDGLVTDAAQLAISPSSIELAPTLAGSSGGSQVFTITNHGGSSSGALVTNTTSTSFSIGADGCAGQVLAPGGTCTVTVGFAPGVAAPLTARLDVASPSSSTASASLAGVGLADASLVLSTATQAFGSVAIGAPSDVSFTLTNVGGQPSGVPALAVTGASDFTIAHNCTTAVAPGAACTITARFVPSAAGARTATLSATATPGGNPSSALSGVGTASGLVISPPTFAFATTTINQSSVFQTFTVRNTGTTGITDLAVAGDTTFVTPGSFGDWCGNALAAGSSCQISATFKPIVAGAATSSLVATGGGATAASAVAATALPLVELIAINSAPGSASSYDFGTQSVAWTWPDDVFVTLTVHSTALPFPKVVEQYGTPAQFQTVGNDCDGAISANQTCTLRLRFTPTTTGTQSGMATFHMTQYVDGTGNHLDLPFSLSGMGAP
jgi:hypothetical protein